MPGGCRSARRAALVVGLLIAGPVAGQGPEAAWRTLETEHFRVHFPAPAEAWTTRVAARLEAIREQVGREVGFTPETVVEVLVMDPLARANGSAWPVLGRPRMVLYTTPPGPSSVLGHYRDWGSLLVAHEQGHLAHLLRPSRNRWTRLSGRLVPLGPIARRAPRWLSEGYATLLEGRLTGFGRPHGDLRAAILRRWAQRGRLPSYDRLSGDRRWQGLSMPYLMGSAYLEWLQARAGEDSLRHLWTRMAAVRQRSFAEAFAGVFGEAPEVLYDRFRAELTHAAITLERETVPRLREGALWQALRWTTGAPALSPDGSRLAIVLRDRDAPSRLVVWPTADDHTAEKRWRQARAAELARDPEDRPAVRRAPLPRAPRYTLVGHQAAPHQPRWIDGDSLLLMRYEGDGRGVLRPDLFRWTPAAGRLERLTHGADLRQADPAPGGGWAVAVRHRYGASQLVRVALADGAVVPLVASRVDVVYQHPRIAPDGRRLAWVEHRDGAWRLMVAALDQLAAARALPLPDAAIVAHPAWRADGGALYAALGSGGFIDLVRFDLDAGAPVTVVRSHGAALAPAPSRDGAALFYLGLDVDGLDLYRLALTEPPPPSRSPSSPSPSSSLPMVAGDDLGRRILTRPPAAPRPPFAAAEPPPSRAYGAGRLEWLPLIGGRFSPSGAAVELVARAGDVVGRLDALAMAASGDVIEGGALAAAWRGWPLTLEGRLLAVEQRPSRQPRAVPGLGTRLDARRRGLELALGWERRSRTQRWRLELGAYGGEVAPPPPAPWQEERSGWLRARWDGTLRRGDWRLEGGAGTVLSSGEGGGDSWQRHGGRLDLGLGYRGFGLALGLEQRRVRGAERDRDRLALGGIEGSLGPRQLRDQRIEVPALPAGSRLGDRYQGQRLGLRWRPLSFFWERHRLRPDGGPRGEWLALYGLELRLARPPWPLLRLPGLELTLGVAELLDAPFEGTVEGWLSLRWRP